MNDDCAPFAQALRAAVLDDAGATLPSLGTAHLLTCAACAARLRFEVRLATALRALGDEGTAEPLAAATVTALVAAWRDNRSHRRATAG